MYNLIFFPIPIFIILIKNSSQKFLSPSPLFPNCFNIIAFIGKMILLPFFPFLCYILSHNHDIPLTTWYSSLTGIRNFLHPCTCESEFAAAGLDLVYRGLDWLIDWRLNIAGCVQLFGIIVLRSVFVPPPGPAPVLHLPVTGGRQVILVVLGELVPFVQLIKVVLGDLTYWHTRPDIHSLPTSHFSQLFSPVIHGRVFLFVKSDLSSLRFNSSLH